MLRCQTFQREVIKHDLDFDGVSVEDVIHFPALQQVAEIGQSVKVLATEGSRDTAAGNTDATERYLAEVALRRRGGPYGEDTLAASRK